MMIAKLALLSILAGAALAAASVSAATPTCDQTSIQAIAPAKTTITSAAEVASTAQETTPYCQVMASITTSKAKGDFIHFEVDLPDASFWNQRFEFRGNGGYGGELASVVGALNYQIDLQAGYAMAATDTGHTAISGSGGAELANASWAVTCNAKNVCTPNTPAVKDFAFRAVHKSTLAAKAIVSGYYSGSTYHSYFSGCSTGGREALVEAQKYPSDFDGLIAGDSVIGDPFVAFNWNAQNFLQKGAYIDPAAISLVNQAVINKCADPNGPAENLVLDPASCPFDPLKLLCASGQTSGCLTSQQVASFNAIYQGAVDTTGKQLYPGYSKSDPGDDAPPPNTDISWENWITGCSDITSPCTQPSFTDPEPWGTYFVPGAEAPSQWIFQDQFLKYFVYNDPNYNSRGFGNFDSTTGKFTDQAAINKITAKSKRWGSDGMNTNLKPFTKLNGKLLMYHGWSDPAISPFQSINYFTSVQSVLGSSTSDNVRLFMIPGMHHCGGGPGPNIFDPLTPLTAWVENGTPPDGIIASHYIDNNPNQTVDRTLPLCSYPEIATYEGPAGGPNGAYNLASNWVCH